MFAGEPSASPELRRVRVLNTQIDNECVIQEVFCLRRSRMKNVIFYLLNVLTLGSGTRTCRVRVATMLLEQQPQSTTPLRVLLSQPRHSFPISELG